MLNFHMATLPPFFSCAIIMETVSWGRNPPSQQKTPSSDPMLTVKCPIPSWPFSFLWATQDFWVQKFSVSPRNGLYGHTCTSPLEGSIHWWNCESQETNLPLSPHPSTQTIWYLMAEVLQLLPRPWLVFAVHGVLHRSVAALWVSFPN